MLDNLSFATPWMLGFLAVLPLLWWLLRLTPPAAKKVIFPALSLLRGLATTEQTPARTPWWLLLLRMIIAALLIIAFAHPSFNAAPVAANKGALLIVVDNDWASARDWEARQKILNDLVREAEHEGRSVLLLPTAPPADSGGINIIGPIAAEAARAELAHITPQPWPADWQQAKAVLQKVDHALIGDVVWIASGLGNTDAKIFYAALQDDGAVKVLGTSAPIYIIAPPQNEEGQAMLAAQRAVTDVAATLTVNAVARDGNILARLPVNFNTGSPRATVPLNLPLDIRNAIARFEIEGQRSAAIALLDSGWQHRPVGLVGDKAELDQHSLLSGLFYIDRALKPYADIHVDNLLALLKQNMAVIILTDATKLNDDEIPQLANWVKHGGVLARFAGEHLASSQNIREAELLPVTLRTGDRALGGSLSWTTPQKLKVFSSDSPFHGLMIPPDVSVSRQVLAEPSPDLTQKAWATLEDSTPLVTAKPIGQGISILFHIPARSDWSNVPLSGLFVDMLRRVVELSHGVPQGGASFSNLPPLRMLDGFGDEQHPGAAAQIISDGDISRIEIDPQHPPGLYGTDTFSRALNLGAAIAQPEALNGVPIEMAEITVHETDLWPSLLAAAFMLLLIDFLISMRLRGLLSLPAKMLAIGFVAFLVSYHSAQAIEDKVAVEVTSKTYIAYVRTGDKETDHVSESGLTSLANILQRRTSIDHVGVTSLDPNTDDLAFFPLLYWPMVTNEAPLSAQGAARVNDYLHHGGMILFDAMNGENASPVLMQRILTGVELPTLVHVPENHVLKRSFYLMNEFPGRFANDDFWLEPEDSSAYDGVATVLYGSNGWAAAWATDAGGKPLFPCTPGGEVQREYAFRFGVNLVMYALTGNYKSDQLHTQALLQRFGK